ncbi:MAG: hypothetical protein HYY25_01735 [Candidatus Wallbacteria bacterium]|nr:hypothetical protein [Candidatus Wallbacteria bacterium]
MRARTRRRAIALGAALWLAWGPAAAASDSSRRYAVQQSLAAGRIASAAAAVIDEGAAPLPWLRRQLFDIASARAPADPLVLRLREPGALGTPVATLMPQPDRSTPSVVEMAGAWALQPDSPQARERLAWWLELADSHQFELAVELPLASTARPSMQETRAMLWLLSARLEALERRDSPGYERCLARAASEGALLPAAWFELASAGPAFMPALQRAREKLRAGDRGAARALFREACEASCRARDGARPVTALGREARAEFPGDEWFVAFEAALYWRAGRAMPQRARWWTLAAAAALARGEGTEAARRLRAGRGLLEALAPGREDWTPWIWAAERLIQGPAPRAAQQGSLLELPPGRSLAYILPDEAFNYAMAQRWLDRARQLGDPRLVLRVQIDPDRPGEGPLVFAEELVRRGKFLEAVETLASVPYLFTEAAGVEVRERAEACEAAALKGIPKLLGPGREELARRYVAMLLTTRRWQEARVPLAGLAAQSPQEPAALGGPSRAQDGGHAAIEDSPGGLDSDERNPVQGALRLLARGRYAQLLARLDALTSGPAVAGGGPGATGGPDLPASPLLGLKRPPAEAWTTPESPYGGAMRPAARRAFRLGIVAVLLAAWTRLHLYLLAIFLPGGAFFRWLRARRP